MFSIYEYTNQPRYWIVRDEQGYWLVPARDNGWQERSPFVGHTTSLREVTDTNGIELGIAGAATTSSDVVSNDFSETLQQLPGLSLSNSHGESAFVTRQGAQVVSWKTADGKERMYLSSTTGGMTASSPNVPAAAIRAGIPVCFPQFSDRGPIVKHGFVRSLPWSLSDGRIESSATLFIDDDAMTRGIWPHAFHAEVNVALEPGRLIVSLTAVNRGDQPWQFTAALHTYLHVDDVRHVGLEGLQHVRYQDATANCVVVEQHDEAVKIAAELDRVYMSPPKKLMLSENGKPSLQIEQEGFEDTVVWNPGPEKAAALTDFPDEDWLHMLCVEAACVIEPIKLQPGESWTGRQILSVPAA